MGRTDEDTAMKSQPIEIRRVLLARGLRAFGDGVDEQENSAILKDEERCIRCALCAMRCPVDAITMERVMFCTSWRMQ